MNVISDIIGVYCVVLIAACDTRRDKVLNQDVVKGSLDLRSYAKDADKVVVVHAF